MQRSGQQPAATRRTIGIVAAAAVVGGVAGGAIGLGLNGDSSPAGTTLPAPAAATTGPVRSSSQQRTGLPPETIYGADAPGVVVITDTQTQVVPPTFFTPPAKKQVGALGSGFVIDRRGDIVTNDHVVEGATGIRVGFGGGASYPAKLVGDDPSTDVAVVRVQAPASVLHPLRFADSSALRVGDPVYAIGNPFGLDRTMTAGIVSAVGRDIKAPNGLTIPNAVQTDAAINHGNSGGPLLDRAGRVIGVNSQIEGGSVDGNVGVGFAVPSDTAESVAAQLIASGHAVHPWLGVQVATIDPTLAKLARGLPARGVLVVSVGRGSPAAKAGLQAAKRRVTPAGVGMLVGGDAIVRLDGKAVASSAQLADTVALRKPGDELRLDVVRGGTRRSVQVTLGNAPAS